LTTTTTSTRSLSEVQSPAQAPQQGDLAIHVVPSAEPRAPALAPALGADGATHKLRLGQREMAAADASPIEARRELSALERMDEALLLVTAESLTNSEVAHLASTSKTLHEALPEEIAQRKLLHGLKKDAGATRSWLRNVIRAETREGPTIRNLQNRAAALFATGLYNHAQTVAEAWIAAAPTAAGGKALLANTHLHAGRPELAVVAAKAAIALNERSTAAETLVRAHLLLGNLNLAQEALQMLIPHFPEVIELHRVLVQHAQGRTAEARVALDALARTCSTSHNTQYATLLAEAYAFLGDANQALEWMQKAGQSEFGTHDMVRVALSPFTANLGDPRWKALRVAAQRLAIASVAELRPAAPPPTARNPLAGLRPLRRFVHVERLMR